MTKATKATLQRLRTMDTRAATLLQEIVETANNVQSYYDEGYEDIEADAVYTENGIFGICRSDYDRKTLSGLRSRYESLISTTFTHGNNTYKINDINQLVKAMAAENPPTCKARKLFVS